MSRHLIIYSVIAGILLCLSFRAFAQQPYSKKDSKIIIQQTWKLYLETNYEAALAYWYGPRPLCGNDDLSKKMRKTRNYLDAQLDEKHRIFEYHHNLVDDFLIRYMNGEECLADTLLKLKLDETNSYGRSRAQIRKNTPRLLEAQAACKGAEKDLDQLIDYAKKEKWAAMMEVLDRPGKVMHLKTYVRVDRLAEFEEILEMAQHSTRKLSNLGNESRELGKKTEEAVKSVRNLSEEFGKIFRILRDGSRQIKTDVDTLKEATMEGVTPKQ